MVFLLRRNRGGFLGRMARKKFIRASAHRFSKLGLRRKKKLIYRKSKGRDNKTRLNKIGRIENVKIGHGHDRRVRGLHQGENVKVVNNIADIKNLNDKDVAIIGKVGDKKRLEIAKYVKDNKIKLKNMDVGKFIDGIDKKMKEKKEKKMSSAEKKKARDKAGKDKDKEKKDKNAEKKKDDVKKETEDKKKDDKLEDKIDEGKDNKDKEKKDENIGSFTKDKESDEKPKDVEYTKKDGESKDDKDKNSRRNEK